MLFWLFSLPAWLCGQVTNSNFEHYTVKDGLSSEQTYNSCQDKEGFLWIGTDAGVSRFDGKVFKNFNTNDGLGDNEIHEIFEDKAGRIWFIPFSGKLSYYYKGKIYLQEVDILSMENSPTISHHIIHSEDSLGNLFLSKPGSSKIMKLNGIAGKVITYNLSPFISGNEGFAAFNRAAKNTMYCITSHNRLLFLGDSTVIGIIPANFLENEKPDKYFTNQGDYAGHVIFLGKRGIYKLNDTTVTLLIPNEKIPDAHSGFVQIRSDAHHNIWINHLLYNTIFYKYVNGKYQDGVSVLKNVFSITSLDNEGNIWFSANDGLYKTSYLKLQDKFTFDLNFNLKSQKVISCAVDRDSALWLGYSDGYVSRIKGNDIQNHNLNIGLRATNRVIIIKSDSAGNLLIGTDETCVVIKRFAANAYGKPMVFKNSDGSYHKSACKGIFFNPQGQAFLTEPIAGPLLYLEVKTNTVKDRSIGMLSDNVRKFSNFFDSKNRLYTSSLSGFTIFENNTVVNLATSDPRFYARINGYAESSDGTVFLATYNSGLIAIKDKKLLSVMPRFNNQNLIYRRILIKNDTLYVATNSGIGILEFKQNKFSLIKMLSTSDGLISPDVSDLAFGGGRLYAVTSHGVSTFPSLFKAAKPANPPTLILQNIVVEDSLYAPTDLLRLSYKTKHIRIGFIAPVLDKPELTEYHYRFNPADEWQITSANFIEFSKLKPGNYNIEIEAKKYNSVWSSPLKIELIVEPPFYNSAWFILSVMLVFTFSVFLIIRARLNKKFKLQMLALKQKEAIEAERNRIAADIHDDIGAELTNITILSQILQHTNSTDKERSKQIINKIESSSNQIITKMNEVIWTLNARDYTLKDLMSYIRNYLGSMQEGTQAKFDLVIDDSVLTEEPVPTEFTRNVFLIIKEIFQNAVKYANAGNISLRIAKLNENNLSINYTDDGVGFDTEKATNGNGLTNIKRRAKLCHGSLSIDSEINKGCNIKVLIKLNLNL